ncbi:phage protease [Shewanella yunxiaonensis]|uniref:Phage protease n=1 Tax=Shewanella yunxiaonensis TaxID=2829809 RepID=A0ABX7YVS8_9GAMM|nr:phage protease [Shewanella yunxiaonensis]QUN06436.1 phage protease [Shewanella yunxiaonensis]
MRKSTTAIAAMTAVHAHLGTVACSLIINEHSDSRVQLLPDGAFAATDGRPTDVPSGQWIMDELSWQSIQANALTRINDFPADYEHQTLRTEENGQPAPAAGWFKPSALGYEPGFGLFANPITWTARAVEYIRGGEYRYISAVFSYDKETGRPIALLHIALTNNPALDGLKAVAALTKDFSTKPQQGDITMNQAQRLLAALGVSCEGVDLTNAEAVTGLIDKGIAACTALKAKADKADASETALAALTAQKKGEVDPTKYVPVEAYNELQTKVAALSSTAGDAAVTTAIGDAEKAGKVYGAADREWLTAIGKTSGVAALTKLLSGRAAIAALTTTQTDVKDTTTHDKGVAALTAEDKAVADELGMSHADFAKAKETK